jgi:hypothetical protein
MARITYSARSLNMAIFPAGEPHPLLLGLPAPFAGEDPVEERVMVVAGE